MTDSEKEADETITFLSMYEEKIHISDDNTDAIRALSSELSLPKSYIWWELNLQEDATMTCMEFWQRLRNVPVVFDTAIAGRVIFEEHKGLLRIIARAYNGDYIIATASDLDARTLKPVIGRIILDRNKV